MKSSWKGTCGLLMMAAALLWMTPWPAEAGGVIVVVRNGTAERRDAQSGAYRGTVGTGKATAVQVSSGVIVVTYADGRSMRYDAATGAYKGTI